MFTKRHLVWLLALLVIFVAFGCSDDDPPTGTTPPPSPTPTVNTITIPAGMQGSSDSHAVQAVGWITIANALAATTSQFVVPGKIQPGSYKTAQALDSVIVTYTIQGLTFSITYWETSTHYYWDLRFDGTDGSYDYSDWLSTKVIQKKDGTAGSMTAYVTNTTTVSASISWTFIGGVYTLTFTDGTDVLEIVVNANGSGSLDYYDDSCLELEIDWNVDGSGSWVEHDCGGGSSGSGSWIAAK